MITSLEQLDLNKKYTYADYLTWQLKERVELIRGFIRKMSTAPNEYHQSISSNLHGAIWSYLKGKTCEVRHAPYDVRLIIPSDTPISDKRRKKATAVSDSEILTVVQPDVLVICDKSKIDKHGCLGAPDLVAEILSEGNNKEDTVEKFSIYESAGVSEYWIVYPNEQTITIYSHNHEGQYVGSKPYSASAVISSQVLPGLEITAEEIFE